MSEEVSIADILVHLHPESTGDNADRIEQQLRARDGVVSVHFNDEAHPHAVVVAYNTGAVTSQEVLAEIKKCDSKAVMVGL